MKIDKLESDVRRRLATLTNTDPSDWFLVYRARHAIETVLRASGKVKGAGEVITQPFTCVTAINPILSADHMPVFFDATIDYYSLDTSTLHANTSSRAIIMQHTFGVESDMVGARRFASKHKLLLIEDSAHKLGLMSRKDVQPLADVSVHSFGADKMLPTKFGAAVWVNPEMTDRPLHAALREQLARLPVVDHLTDKKARGYRWFNRFMNAIPSSRKHLTALGIFEAPIAPEEVRGRNHGRPARPSAWMLQRMIEGLKHYSSNLKKRSDAVTIYRQELGDTTTHSDEALVRFPMLCSTTSAAEKLFQTLTEKGYYAGRWYRPTLFPGATSNSLYNYDPETCPVAEDLSRRIVNLPTNVSHDVAKEIAHVVRSQTL